MSGDGIADGGVEAAAKVNVRIVNGHPFTLRVKLNSTVEEFRKEITDTCAIRDDRLLLIYKDCIMRDGLTLQSYGVEAGEIVDAVEFCDARTVIANSTEQMQREEDLMGNLEKLDLSALENLVNDPKFLRNLNMNNTRMLAICDRNITVLSQVNDRLTMLRNSAAAGSSQASSSTQPQIALNPSLHTMFLSNLRVRDILQNPRIGFDSSDLQTRDMLPQIGQMASSSRGQPSQEAAQNDGGTILAEERYVTQLADLQKMGFFDIQENIRALNATGGDSIAAAQYLVGLGNPNP